MNCPVHTALVKRHLVLGGDREGVMLTFLFAFVGAVVADFQFVPMLWIGVLAFLLILGLRQLARMDAWYLPILRRALRMPDFLPARSTVNGATQTP